MNDKYKEYYDYISNFEESKKLKIDDHNVLHIYDYFKLKEESLTNKDSTFIPIINYDTLEISYLPKKMEFNVKGLEGELLTANLDNFYTDTEERKTMLKVSLKFINDLINNIKTSSIYFYGGFGAGKTYLSACILNYLSAHNITGLFSYLPDLSRSCKSDFNALENLIIEHKKTKVLVLDDLGSENSSAWFRDEILMPIINYRVMNNLPIIYTSNNNYAELINFFSDNGIKNKAVRMVYRIKNSSLEVNCGKNIKN